MDVSEVTAVLSGVIDPKQRIIQNFRLIWLNEKIDKSMIDYQNTLIQLQSIVNIVHAFTQRDEAIDFLTEINVEKIFLVIEANTGQDILSLIHDIPQLDAIYIFSGNKAGHEQWTTKWSKIKGVHTCIQTMCEALQLAAQQCNQDCMTMSFIKVDVESSKLNLDQLEPTFMYTQLFKEILLTMKYDEQSIAHLAIYCRTFYENNRRELNLIDEFKQNYRSKSPIWWYTRQCFIYQMLNRALRTLEGDTIINMGFFICDLHSQIKKLHKNQIGTYNGRSFTVYRGQGLLVADFEKLQKTIGGLMSFNNFLSTSVKRDVSLRFTRDALTKTNMVGILFRMTIDPSVSSTSFASIREDSFYRTEEEILFSMHTVFRVNATSRIDDSKPLYQVDLQLTADDDQELRTLTAVIRNEIDGEIGWTKLGSLLLKVGQVEKAEQLYNALLEQTPYEFRKACCYNELGRIKYHQGDYRKAFEYYEKALEIFQQQILPPKDPYLANVYHDIGDVYDNMGEYSKALLFHRKAAAMHGQDFFSDTLLLANSYRKIGGVYSNLRDHAKALKYHQKALEISQKELPPNHPDLATSYSKIGLVYNNMGEYSKVLSFLEKALEIRQKILPPNHLLLATSYYDIGDVYDRMGKYSEALTCHEKALEISEKSLPPNHPDLATSYNKIGGVYSKMGEYSKALLFHQKALEINQKTLSPTGGAQLQHSFKTNERFTSL